MTEEEIKFNKELEQKESFMTDHLARTLIMIAKGIFQNENQGNIWGAPGLAATFTSQT